MTIPSWAVRGAKVALVDDSPGYFNGVSGTKHTVFTLTETIEEDGRVGCRVAEWNYGPFEYTSLARFRPLVTEEDDLATHFEQYLKTDHRATERERA